MSLKETSDTQFGQDVLESANPVLVDFYADWCGPCRMLTPLLEEIANEMSEQINIIKINIDNNPETPSQFGVRSIPTMILFKDGQAVSTKVGLGAKPKIVEWIQGNI